MQAGAVGEAAHVFKDAFGASLGLLQMLLEAVAPILLAFRALGLGDAIAVKH